MDEFYVDRIYNRADSQVRRKVSEEARKWGQEHGQTWQETLRLIADEVCLCGKLDENNGKTKSAAQASRIKTIKETRSW